MNTYHTLPFSTDNSRARQNNVMRRLARPALARRLLRTRGGAAVVEFAVCLPLLTMLILGSIEATSAVFLKQSLQTAAYEAARIAVRSTGTTADARTQAEAILSARQIRNFDITFAPANVRDANRGTRVTITITARRAANSPIMGRVIPDDTASVRVVMIKE